LRATAPNSTSPCSTSRSSGWCGPHPSPELARVS
jgi:hypothetical protein